MFSSWERKRNLLGSTKVSRITNQVNFTENPTCKVVIFMDIMWIFFLCVNKLGFWCGDLEFCVFGCCGKFSWMNLKICWIVLLIVVCFVICGEFREKRRYLSKCRLGIWRGQNLWRGAWRVMMNSLLSVKDLL